MIYLINACKFCFLRFYLLAIYGSTIFVSEKYEAKICRYILSFKPLAKKYAENMGYDPDIIE